MNVDTPYSYAWLDLRDGPVELTMPPVPEGRYMAAELFDLYTYIVGYVSPRTTGRSGERTWSWDRTRRGRHAGTARLPLPDPAVPRPRANRALRRRRHGQRRCAAGRHLVQAPGAGGASPLVPIEPVDVRAAPTPRFLEVLDWMLLLMPVLPEDEDVRGRIQALRGASRPRCRGTITAGLADGLADVVARTRTVRSSGEIFGSREMLQSDPLSRAAGAFLGILGNAAEEYLGVGYHGDADGRPFDGTHRYRIHFAAGGLPPVDAFWSITVYDGDQFLYANPIDRYRVSSHDIGSIPADADGGLTDPGPERTSDRGNGDLAAVPAGAVLADVPHLPARRGHPQRHLDRAARDP